ncbi:CHL1 [Enterospora canceri]|uniref:ATP-dependent DNA helicase CHL1 n=1 Tax=Enterospora canceri TaxID=1081671 RepID=A0A1Y1S624_9MICR|nr:CHL1 [Enterospora canceri]
MDREENNNHGFPKKLYKNQLQFIKDGIETINTNSCGIFSSPTGTGKTISLLIISINYMNKTEDDLFDLLRNSNKTKIYYCSRTHSQLNQVMEELNTNSNLYKSTILGSRKLYCINKNVDKTKDIEEINEACFSLIKKDACEYFKNNDFYQMQNSNIVDMKNKGKCETFCPYYYTKNRASECEMVLLPYNLLFTPEGRNSIDLDLEDKILIVDEAHNIYETVIDLNTVEISYHEIKKALYTRGINQEITEILTKIIKFREIHQGDITMLVNDYILEANLEKHNMIEVDEFIKENKLAQKNENMKLFHISKFIKLLTYSDSNGLIIHNRNTIKFTCLNPALYFDELKRCRSLLFAGGTMEPTDQLINIFKKHKQIKSFNYYTKNRKILPIILEKTIDNQSILLTYENRNHLIESVIKTIKALTSVVKMGGTVIFVPSILDLFKICLKNISFDKPIYFEEDFNQFEKNPQILIAVLGGKYSEGINFKDEMCRLLIVVGVPFPAKSPEYLERCKHDKEYAVNTAMKKVNQAIGRSIRDNDDYSVVVLMDSRYSQLKHKLSGWVSEKLETKNTCMAIDSIIKFLG